MLLCVCLLASPCCVWVISRDSVPSFSPLGLSCPLFLLTGSEQGWARSVCSNASSSISSSCYFSSLCLCRSHSPTRSQHGKAKDTLGGIFNLWLSSSPPACLHPWLAQINSRANVFDHVPRWPLDVPLHSSCSSGRIGVRENLPARSEYSISVWHETVSPVEHRREKSACLIALPRTTATH